ncbi:hypothetical protein RRG08_050992 [Elysia crispata]|uniref:Uncharacterized protein n=1 Tax=Elysia crispata TaxID=231223 RepID=A0AAE1D5Z4_9GAST|nr:hypothetical protein RRG08_050992 [Elysia crispata]
MKSLTLTVCTGQLVLQSATVHIPFDIHSPVIRFNNSINSPFNRLHNDPGRTLARSEGLQSTRLVVCENTSP